MRKRIVAGNWKMNKTPDETVAFINTIKDRINTDRLDVVLCVPFVDLMIAKVLVKDTNIAIGAQNMHFEESGAFTGEISGVMLAEMGVPYVIIGHSERRQYFGETDTTVNKKVLKAIEKGLKPIICVGESISQRNQGITTDLVRMQTRIALQGVDATKALDVVIAYEPIWAIGTGQTATSLQAQEVCASIRQVLSEIYDRFTADAIRIQYGGSVNASNAAELFSMPDIDGALVGGASIKDEFTSIVGAL